MASVAHDETAVDVYGLARHVIGVTAGEKAHDASNVFRSFGSPEWDQRGSPLPGFTDFPALYFGPLGVDLPHIGVSTAPGQMQFEVILSVASTCAAVRVMLTTPALLAA